MKRTIYLMLFLVLLSTFVIADFKFKNVFPDFNGGEVFELEYEPEELYIQVEVLTPEYTTCDLLNYSDCLDFFVNGSCSEYSEYQGLCLDGYSSSFEDFNNKNITRIKITQAGNSLLFDGLCCEYYTISPYNAFSDALISCKQEITGICNPLIQQTANDPLKFDELGLIYLLSDTGIVLYEVGTYDYYDRGNILISEVVQV